MTLKFKTKILLIFLALALIVSLLNAGIAGFVVEKNLTTDLVDRSVVSTRAEVAELTNFVLTQNKGGIITLIFNQKKSNADMAYQIVLDEHGELLASTLINQNNDDVLFSHVLPKGEEQHVLLTTLGEKHVYDVALRLDYNLGVLRVGYYKEQIDTSVRTILSALLIGILMSLLVAIVLGIFFAKIFSKPLEELTASVQKVAAGDLTARAMVSGKDELGFLALTINEMTAKLEVLYHGMEERVIARTVELDAKVKELESINKFMVNRELKMIELKKEITSLRGETPNDSTL